MSYFSLQQLSVKLGHFQLRQISLSLESGQTLVILGPSGSGKSVLLETVAGFNTPSGGRINLNGADITALPPEKRELGYVFQNYALFPHLTVEQNVSFGLRRHPERQRRTREMLDLLGIRPFAQRKTGTLSGGEKQRVALARALARNPSLFLFDEPLSAVDAAAREGLRDELHHFLRSFQATSLYVTHDRTEAMVLADVLAVINNGQVRQIGQASEVFAHPADSWVARFVGMQVLRPQWVKFLDNNTAQVGIGGTTLTAGINSSSTSGTSPWMVAFQPEDVLVTRSEGHLQAGQNTIPLVMDKVISLGPLVRIDLRGDTPLTALILRRQYFELNLQPGDAVNAHIGAADLQLVPEAAIDRTTDDGGTG